MLLGQPFSTKFDHVFLPLEHQSLNCCCASGAVLTEPFPAGSVEVTCHLPGFVTVIVWAQDGSAQQLFPTYVLYPLELVSAA